MAVYKSKDGAGIHFLSLINKAILICGESGLRHAMKQAQKALFFPQEA